MQREGDWKEWAARLFCLSFCTVAAYLAVKHCLSAMLLSMAVIFISRGIHGLSKRLCRATRIPVGVWAFTILTLMLVGLGALMFCAARALISQLSAVARSFGGEGLAEWHELIYALGEMPVIGKLIYDSGEYATAEVAPVLSGLLEYFSGALRVFVSGVLKATPSAIMSGAVALMSLYYMSSDFDGICSFVRGLLPPRTAKGLSKIKKSAVSVGMRFVRAQLILFLMTFCEVFAGLLIIRPQYALLGALGIAAVDMLPVLGSGTVLIPWSLICFVRGDVFSGVALLVMYVAVSAIRRIAEPRIIGQSMGLPPFGALMCMYLGYRMFGVLGMFIAPAAVSAVAVCMQNKDKGVE